jgi:hypothetical protein
MTDIARTDPELKAAWDRYYVELEQSRLAIEASDQFQAVPRQRAKAYHALMEMQAMTYNFAVAPRLAFPRVFGETAWQTEIYTMGGNGPDFAYKTLFIDGAAEYRLTGNMHDSRILLAQLSGALPGSEGQKAACNYDFIDFTVDADGSFEVVLSARQQSGNWIELDPEAPYQWILFRPTVDGWDSRLPDLNIERTSPLAPGQYDADEFDPAAIARRIDMATGWLRYMTNEWVINFYQRVYRNAGGPNQFKVIGKEISGEVGSPTAEYLLAAYEVNPDEALLIEMPDTPGGAYWGLQIFDVWLRSLDFRTRQTGLNGTQIRTDSDGKVRVVMSNRDPGLTNWIDVGEYDIGQVLFRNYRTLHSTEPTIRRIKFDDLQNHLPAEVARVTPEQRAADLHARREAYRSRHGQ